jgi:serine/threonine-protein kinase
MANLIGQTLGQYQITAFLGRGGMATVYRARQASINRDVAIKVIKPDLVESEEFKVRFTREAQVIATMSHPHILKVFDYGQHGDLVYLVMELLSGGSLADLLRGGGSLSLNEATRLLDQIAGALDYAHRRAIVHRDLKPQNVLLDEDKNAFLTDFGIAKLLGETSALTQSGMAMGTPAYMSPEQWRGQNVDARADVYALGVMLYEMLAGKVPFTGDTPYSMMHMHVFETPPSIRSFRPDLPDSLQNVLNIAMAKERDQRFGTAGEVANAFKAALAGMPIGAAADTADLTAPVPVRAADPNEVTLGAPVPVAPTQAGAGRSATPLGVGAEEEEKKPANRAPILIGVALLAVLGVLAAVLALGGGQGSVAQTTATATDAPISATPDRVTETPTLFLADEATATALARLPTAASTDQPTDQPTETPTLFFADEATATALALLPTAASTDQPTGQPTETPTLFFADEATATALALLPTQTSAAQPAETPTRLVADEATATAFARLPTDSPPTETRTPTFTASPTNTATLTFTPSLTATPTPNLTNTARAELIATSQAERDLRRTQSLATITAGAATAQVQRTRLAELQLTGTARAANSTATALALPTRTPTPNLDASSTARAQSAITATVQAQLTQLAATVEAVLTVQMQQTRLAELQLTGTARAAHSTATAVAVALAAPTGRIIFHTDLYGRWEINQIAPDGGNFFRLTDGRGVYYLPSFSPDGTLIGLSSNLPGNIEIYIMNADASNLRRVTQQGAEDWGVAISPDNTRIVWHSNRGGTFRLYIADIDGRNVRQLTPPDSTRGSLDADASWAPDSKRIVFAASRTPKGLYFMDVDTGVLAHFAAAGEDAEDPAWSPDGTRIAFQSKRDGNQEIYVINVDGTGLRRLTNHPAVDGRPAWSPDSQWIAFESERDGKLDIYIMRADGTDVRRVTTNEGKNGWASWAR